MAKNERSSPRVASIAAKALQKPSAVTPKQVKSLAGSVLTQTADKGKPTPKGGRK